MKWPASTTSIPGRTNTSPYVGAGKPKPVGGTAGRLHKRRRQIVNPDADWIGTGIFQWPLPQSYTITSWFGYREDPFTGEIAYHSGTDIAAPEGTPILAAADGTVTIANAIDSWGGGYGYHIKVNHNDTFDTLYAHCSSICVTVGQEVKQGEVIGYVGTTGNSTGNHLHFEVWQNGERTDASVSLR